MHTPHYLYFMISSTPTRMGYLIRKIGHNQYNHTSIALDASFKQLYGFARKQHCILVGGLALETMDRYTLRKVDEIDAVIFRVPVSKQQYQYVKEKVLSIYHDEEYMYNLYSVLSYPMLGGFKTYKAYSCIEFVLHILDELGFVIPMPHQCGRPDDLLYILKDYVYFQGNLLDYCSLREPDPYYYAPMDLEMLKKNIDGFKELTRRTLFRH